MFEELFILFVKGAIVPFLQIPQNAVNFFTESANGIKSNISPNFFC